MKVWVYVEGHSDRLALEALWAPWKARLRQRGWGLEIIPLDHKSGFLKRIGARAAHKLASDACDLVVGLPDLYPNAEYRNTAWAHNTHDDLRKVQEGLVKRALRDRFGLGAADADERLGRFCGTCLKHDLEMLLLAAPDALRAVLETAEQLGEWRHPVEDQNQVEPPKRVVERLFREKSRRRESYRNTDHAVKVLGKVASDITAILRNRDGQPQCPVFEALLEWMGARTGVAFCS